MDCPDCQGTGKLATNPYREAPPMKQEEKPKSPPWYRRINWEKSPKFIAIGFVACVVGFALYSFVKVITSDVERASRAGVIMVQYDDKGQAVRCWVYQEPSSPPVRLTDHYATAAVSERRDIEGLIKTGKSLGIENMQMCDGAGR